MIDQAAWVRDYCRTVAATGRLETYQYSRPAETSTRSGTAGGPDQICRDVLPSSGIYEG